MKGGLPELSAAASQDKGGISPFVGSGSWENTQFLRRFFCVLSISTEPVFLVAFRW